MSKLSYEELKNIIIKHIMDMSDEGVYILQQDNQIFLQKEKNNKKFLLNFNAIYERYLNGETIEHLVDMVIEPIVREKDMFEYISNWEKVKLRLFPQLKNANDIANIMVSNPSPIPTLSIVYVVDSDKNFMFVTPDFMETWGVNQEELHKQAMNNLHALSKKRGIRLFKEGNFKFYFSSTNDGYDAVRILTANYQQIKQTLKGKIYVGVPNRDMLVIFNGNEDYSHRFIQQNIVQFQTNRYRLTPFTFEWDGKRFTPIIKDYTII